MLPLNFDLWLGLQGEPHPPQKAVINLETFTFAWGDGSSLGCVWEGDIFLCPFVLTLKEVLTTAQSDNFPLFQLWNLRFSLQWYNLFWSILTDCQPWGKPWKAELWIIVSVGVSFLGVIINHCYTGKWRKNKWLMKLRKERLYKHSATLLGTRWKKQHIYKWEFAAYSPENYLKLFMFCQFLIWCEREGGLCKNVIYHDWSSKCSMAPHLRQSLH